MNARQTEIRQLLRILLSAWWISHTCGHKLGRSPKPSQIRIAASRYSFSDGVSADPSGVYKRSWIRGVTAKVVLIAAHRVPCEFKAEYLSAYRICTLLDRFKSTIG